MPALAVKGRPLRESREDVFYDNGFSALTSDCEFTSGKMAMVRGRIHPVVFR